VELMRPGSVIVDLAAEQGGNCELTVPDELVVRHGVTIIGYTDLPSRLPTQSSELYATNLRHLLTDLCPRKDGELVLDLDDEVVRAATVVKDGEVVWEPPKPPPPAAAKPKPPAAPAVTAAEAPAPTRPRWLGPAVALVLGGLALLGIGAVAPPSFMSHFTVFVLACFVGYMVIWNVTPALHTPLMSVTNAISGIIILGAMLQADSSSNTVVVLSVLAALIASINIAGGFHVTRRMLKMFRKD